MNTYLIWGSTGALSGSLVYYVYHNSRYRYKKKITLLNSGTYIGLSLGIVKAYLDKPL